MRITESKLRNLINDVISEMSEMSHEVDMHAHEDDRVMLARDFMDKAEACCRMALEDVVRLFDMCSQICFRNESMSSHCAELCACACRGDVQGCCRCLGEICKCRHCAQICADCCGC